MANRETQRRRWTLEDLEGESGVPARTIRFYIARGLLPAPAGAGRAACYGREHLGRLRAIRRLQAQNLTLAEIAWKLGGQRPAAGPPQPAPWLSFPVAGDVTVLARADVAPWRMNRIRAAVAELAARLRSEDGTEENGNA